MVDEPEAKPLSDPFTKMAEKIEHNDTADFGGAFVIVPPTNGGTPLQALMLNNAGDAAQFWIMLQGMVTTAITNLQQQQQAQSPYGRPR